MRELGYHFEFDIYALCDLLATHPNPPLPVPLATPQGLLVGDISHLARPPSQITAACASSNITETMGAVLNSMP